MTYPDPNVFAEYDAVQAAFKDDSVLSADKPTLIKFLMAIARARPNNDLNRAAQREQGELVRLLIAAKDSQETHTQATAIAKAALFVAIAALAISGLQFLLSLVQVLCRS